MGSLTLSLQDYYTAQFYAWEYRGRGLKFYSEPVDLEPEFIPFKGHRLPERNRIDDGERARFFPALVHEFSHLLGSNKQVTLLQEDEAEKYLEEQYPLKAYCDSSVSQDPIELQLSFPNDLRIGIEYIEELLLVLSDGIEHLSFEIIATSETIGIQFACRPDSTARITSYIREYLPDVIIQESTHSVIEDYVESADTYFITDLGLSEEFTRPLRTYNRFEPDPYAALIASMSNLREGECVVYQVLFKAAINPWGESMLSAVSNNQGRSFFQGDASMLDLAREKVSKPLCVACPRIAVFAGSYERADDLSNQIIQSIKPLEQYGSNSFTAIQHPDATWAEVLYRHSLRTGMIVNVAELATMVHIPDQSIRSEKLRYGQGKTKEAPHSVIGHDFVLGSNTHLSHTISATLSTAQRLRHMHVIGATGTGKSNFFLGCIKQDMELGNGLCVLDPHGDLVEKAMLQMPDNRIQDVIIIDPSDEDFPVGLNLLDAKTEAEKIILSSDLVSLFKRFATSWGDQMTSVLANAINAFLNREEGGTLIELKRFLTEKAFREETLKTVSDPTITYYWKHEFPLLRSNSIASILTRLDTFLRSPLVRNMMAQRKGLDFHDIINSKKILLIKLSQGLIGEENSYLLGSIIIAKLHQAALHRQTMQEAERTPFFLYVDEFQHFITPSMSAILSGARKYGLGLNMAHQDMEQVRVVDRELANSILANPATRVIFRSGEQDSKQLAQGLLYFDETDLQNLSIGHAIARVERKDHDFNISTSFVQNPFSPDVSAAKTRVIVEWSRKTYGGSREAIEKELFEQYQQVSKPVVPEPQKPKAEPLPQPIQAVVDETPVVENKEVLIPAKEADELKRKDKERRELREHRYLQDLIKRTGESFGFKSTIEDPTPDGKGMIDVTLKRDDMSIAVEVAVTNTVDYEVKNIQKCLNTGFDIVIVCSKQVEHLKAILRAASSIELAKVQFHTPESLSQFIQSFAQPQTKEEVVKGYRVKLQTKPQKPYGSNFVGTVFKIIKKLQ